MITRPAYISKIVPSGNTATVTNFTYSGNGTFTPAVLAVDTGNNIWVADNTAGKAVEFSNAGVYTTQSVRTLGSVVGLSIDASNNLLFGQNSRTELVWLKPPSYTATTFSDTSLYGLAGQALDASGNLWAAGETPSFGVFTKTSSTYSESSEPTSLDSTTGNYDPGPGGAITPDSVAVDGANNIWFGDYNNGNGGYLVEITTGFAGISPSTGYTSTAGTAGGAAGPFSYPLSLAIDGSGNVWTTDNSNLLIELIGAATPVVTPLAQGAATGKIGTRP